MNTNAYTEGHISKLTYIKGTDSSYRRNTYTINGASELKQSSYELHELSKPVIKLPTKLSIHQLSTLAVVYTYCYPRLSSKVLHQFKPAIMLCIYF